MPKLKIFVTFLLLVIFELHAAHSKSDPGKTSTTLDRGSSVAREQRPLLANTQIKVKIECERRQTIVVYWRLTEHECWLNEQLGGRFEESNASTIVSPEINLECQDHPTFLPEWKNTQEVVVNSTVLAKKPQHPLAPIWKPIYTTTYDGIYGLEVRIKENVEFSATVYVEMIGPHGYISATDWPLLPFYGIMCIVYVTYGVIWLVVSFMQWRDLLRIQFWIGGVILLGMLEKAFFYAQYQTLNHTGESVQGAEMAAEFVSCAKRTLARMLVIIMSLGFGIVKPRLGPMLHRVVGVGALYFILACIESYLRVMRTKGDVRNELLVASIPLAVLDTGICWWIFTSLVQTTRTLRLRRNMVKLTLYRHFTNTLIFSIIASVIFMLYAMHLRKIENCTPYWKDIWLDNAFWHILFSVLLLVIMILWRPTNNNQRYAFTPLLDNPEDEDEDEEEDQFVADAYGVKMRSSHTNGTRTPPNNQRTTTTEEDDLRWVEENIPSSMGDPALPVLDSDEEIINTKFEVSKMQ